MLKKIPLAFSIFATLAFLTACGPSEKDAQQLGFASVAEMKEAQSKGFKNKAEALEGEAKSLGFRDSKQMQSAKAQGFKNFDEYKQQSEKLGFANVEEMEDLMGQGYRSKLEFTRANNKEGSINVPEEYIDPNLTYWVGVVGLENGMDKSEPMTKCSKFADTVKTGQASMLYSRFDKNGYKWVGYTPKNSFLWGTPFGREMAQSMNAFNHLFEVISFDTRGEDKATVTYRGLKGLVITTSYVYDKSHQVRYLTSIDGMIKAANDAKMIEVEEAKKRGDPGAKEILCQGRFDN